jgi:hypothetical protein
MWKGNPKPPNTGLDWLLKNCQTPLQAASWQVLGGAILKPVSFNWENSCNDSFSSSLYIHLHSAKGLAAT